MHELQPRYLKYLYMFVTRIVHGNNMILNSNVQIDIELCFWKIIHIALIMDKSVIRIHWIFHSTEGLKFEKVFHLVIMKYWICHLDYFTWK